MKAFLRKTHLCTVGPVGRGGGRLIGQHLVDVAVRHVAAVAVESAGVGEGRVERWLRPSLVRKRSTLVDVHLARGPSAEIGPSFPPLGPVPRG